ncbi:30S ribosomal protein S17 [Candidatus Gracilibacteria bacterium]|nr:MAG: 30S ribosomal protein S17 [Candidatus Gracilibacteria bacterium]
MRKIKGLVTSVKMDKTAVVSVVSYKNHEKYKKRFKSTKKFYAHDEKNTCKEGDVVVIQETKPTSKLKRWEIVES